MGLPTRYNHTNVAAATTTTLSNILKQVYLPAVVQQLNNNSLFLRLLCPTLDEAIKLGADKLMGTATLSTLQNVLTDFFAPAVQGHKLEDVQIHRRPDADMITLHAYCKDCKQVYAQNISMPALYAAKGNLDGIRDFLNNTVKSFFQYIEDQPCLGKGAIAAIAAWLTEKLVERKSMPLADAAELWQQEGENWPKDVVEETARSMGFMEEPKIEVETLLPPLESLEPLHIEIVTEGLLRLPEDHPLAVAA